MLENCRQKLIVSFVCVLVFALQSAAAAAVSFHIVQHDSTQRDVRTSTFIVENEFFDQFFNYGYIATNFPVTISNSFDDEKVNVENSLAYASDINSNYLIVVTIDYKSFIPSNPNAVLLSNIEKIKCSLFDVTDGKELYSRERLVDNVTVVKNNERGVRDFARDVAYEVISKLPSWGSVR